MNIVSTPLGNREVEVMVEITAERFAQAKAAAARELAKKVNIPGFRRGKAPQHLIVRHYGEGVLVQQAIEDLGQKLYKEALDAEKLEPGAMGEFTNFDLEKLQFTYKVPLVPLVELGDYREMRVYFEPAEVVDEVDVENELNKARESQAVVEPVERAAQFGDLVTLAYQAVLVEDEEFEVFGSDSEELTLQEDATEPAPGFHDEIVGLSVGQSHEFTLTLPEDYSNLSLAGQVVRVNATVEGVKGKTLPALNDAFAAELTGEENMTLAELQERVRTNMQRSRDGEAEGTYAEQVMAHLLGITTVEYPPAVLKEEVDALVEERKAQLKRRDISLEHYLRIEGKTEDEFRTDLEATAHDRLRRTLILSEFIKKERLQPTERDMQVGLARLFNTYGIPPEQISPSMLNKEMLDSVSRDVLYNKAVACLCLYARGEDPYAPVEDAETADADVVAEASVDASGTDDEATAA